MKQNGQYQEGGTRQGVMPLLPTFVICLSLQFVETNEDGDRDWGAHVKGGDGALDKVRSEAVTFPWLL